MVTKKEKNVKIMKAIVEKDSSKSSKIVQIFDNDGKEILKLHVFLDGDVFIRKANKVWIEHKRLKFVEINSDDENDTYTKIQMNEMEY